ncbi:MAG: helix-hairpin-helix domain-containing protein [candidate division WOR-3 bacterium]|nr:helix-hairpin-helix domain-containing protein [candidate division WOR-3 bacterium]MCX7948068.1 helix-hairpin-helix domain-containing protein [candidate division WOR-3 bacterium]MDW8150994.1 helix-hairpin-helix domain-containing protein [candidate division WOR-3 bacterium]
MPKLLLLLIFTEYTLDSLNLQIVNINSASYSEISSLPFLTEEDIQKIIKQRPYRSFDEFADSLNLSSFEREIIKNFVYIPKTKRSYKFSFLFTSKYDSSLDIRYKTSFIYRDLELKVLRNKAIFRYKSLYFGNFKIAKGLGLISSTFYRNNIYTNTYFDNALSFLIAYRNFEIFIDSSLNYFFGYNFENFYLSALGNRSLNGLIGLKYGFFHAEFLFSNKLIGYAYRLYLKNDIASISLTYKNLKENIWDFSRKDEKFSISSRFKYLPLVIYSKFSNNYQTHSINYSITDGTRLELRISKASYKFEFNNEEGLKIGIFKERAIKIGYKFVSIYQYNNISSICDEYIPLHGCYISLNKNNNYQFAINLDYKFIRIFYSYNLFFLTLKYSL